MPLKINKKLLKENPNSVEEGAIIQTVNGAPMSLFSGAKLPMVTLHANQFIWPKTLLVVQADRIPVYTKDPETGWNLKDSSGHKIPTEKFEVRLQVVNGDIAQKMADDGQPFDGLSQIQCTIHQDIPLQKVVPGETLIQLVKPTVMLGFGGQNVDRIILVAQDFKEV